MKTERDVIERLGPPDEIVRPEDRMRSRSWLCSTCRTATTTAAPLPIPAPCAKCGGLSFETVETPPHQRAPEIRPSLHPRTTKTIPHGDGWLHEPKLDGYRLQVIKDGTALRLYSRSGYDWTKRLAVLADALAAIRCQSAVIDCELIFPTSEGHPDFRALQAAIGDRKRHHDLAVFAFDLLYHDGKDLRPMPLIERRLELTELVARRSVQCLHLVQGFDNGAKLFKAAEQHGLEGIVSKRQTSAYRSGLSHDWVKIKTAGWRDANRERWRLFEKR